MTITLTIILIILCIIALTIIALLNSEESGEHVAKIVVMFILLGIIMCNVYDLGYNSGLKDGACNQLRGKYEVTYVIDKDSCVVDTIINIK